MKLRYKAAAKDGKSVQGIIEAKDAAEAANYLRSKDLLPIRVKREEDNLLTKLLPFNKVGSHDIIVFTRQLSSMLSSGLTLMKCLQILKEQMQDKSALGAVFASIIADVEEGKPLSYALSRFPNLFSNIYISSVKAGEMSGLLDKVLLRLAENMEKQAKLKSMVKGALIYPAIVVILMAVVVIVLMIFVIPQLSTLYENLGVSLPLSTLIIVSLSKFTIVFWPFILAGVVLGIFLFRRWKKTESGKMIYDTLILKIPIFGKIIKESILVEFTRTFGLLIGTGTLVVESMIKTADTLNNVNYKNAVKDISNQVEKGIPIGDAMAYYTIFPPLLVQLVKIGEQTGKLDENLAKASEYFETEVDQAVKNLTTIIDPIIMVTLGVGVAFLIIAVITPIYGLISKI